MAQPQPRVLVITAIHSIYTLIQRTLKAQGFHTTHVISGDKAQTYLEDETHHLIILDLTHTKPQQIDDYHRLQRNTTIPLIVLINGESGQHNRTIADIVTDNYLYYPFDPDDLLVRVRNALRPRQTSTTQRPSLHLGKTTIHFDERRAMCNGQKVHLTRTEWKLLETLALYQGKTLTYRTLLQHVWGDVYQDEHNYVHTYISQLRRKLEPDPTKPCYLLTEVGVGYRLEASTNGTHPPEPTATTDSNPEKTTETPWKLTTPSTKLFGRETDTEKIQHLLGQTDVRLLTLTGPPGVGKTRLAQHIAEAIQHQFTDGLYTVSLAPLRDHSLVISAIAQTLGAKESAHQTLHQALMQTLKGQQALLFLDNFEHVLEAASLIAELIDIAPDLTILVTSRTPLRISGEQEYPVPPLTTPDSTIPVSSETLAHNPAVALFVRRSQAVKPDFVLTDENAPAVAAICTRLDGLPLAIELAAARSKLFSPQALLARLDQRLALLSHNTTDAPERHQTLRAAIDWSYQLLQPEEQRILAGLSVFAGGCTLEASTSVLNNDRQLLPELPLSNTSLSPDPQTLTMINHLTTLVNHSLVQIKEDRNNEPRFMLLETIREYAWEKLVESDEVEKVQQRFAEYYWKIIKFLSIKLTGEEQGVWLEHLSSEYSNIQEILQWSLQLQKSEINLSILGTIWFLWISNGQLSEGSHWFDRALSANTYSSPEIYAKALNGAGVIATYQGKHLYAVSLFEKSLDWWQQTKDESGAAHALNNLALVFQRLGKYDEAFKLFEESLVIRQRIANAWEVATTLVNMGALAEIMGKYQDAEILSVQSLKLFREKGDPRGVAHALHTLGTVAVCQKRFEDATRYLYESRDIFLKVKGAVDAAYIYNDLAYLALLKDNYQYAIKLLSQSLVICSTANAQDILISCLERFTGILIVNQQVEKAIYLYSALQHQRSKIDLAKCSVDQFFYEHIVLPAQAQLDESTWQQAWDEGQKMSLEEAIDYALEHVVGNERAAAS